MGKLFNSLILSSIVVIALALFDKNTNAFSPIVNLFFNPPTDAGQFIVDLLTSSIGAVTLGSLAAIFIGTYVVRLDWLVRAGMFTTIVTWVASPMVDLWNSVSSKIVVGGNCGNTALCINMTNQLGGNIGNVIAGILVGPMILYVVWSVAEYVWSGDR